MSPFKNLFNQFYIFRNALDYPLREFFKWRRSGLVLPDEPKTDLIKSLPDEAQQKIQLFTQTYHLQNLATHSSQANFQVNLYYLDLLETAFSRVQYILPTSLKVLDVGVSDWFYICSLHAFLSHWQSPLPRQLQIDGYEIDAYRIYQDLYSRWDYAQFYSKGLEKITYHPHAFTPSTELFTLGFMFFPFIFIEDHLEWGLTKNQFSPQNLLASVWQSLTPGGLLLIVNQGSAEQKTQLKNLEALGIQPLDSFLFHSVIKQYSHQHFVTLARHE
jgi:hypothetical protein